jgi:hypothetical protein
MPVSDSDAVDITLSGEFEALAEFYDTTEAYLDDLANPDLFGLTSSVSDWSPAQHLYHIWRANASMLKAARLLAAGRVESESAHLTDAGRRILTTGHLPRGVASAPEAVRPPDALDRELLRETVRRSREKLDAVTGATDAIRGAEGGIEHPAWGVLTAPQWVRAARVHSEHHGAIVRDILDGFPA